MSNEIGPIWRTVPATSAEETARLGTRDLRAKYLLEDLFVPGTIRLVYTELDRMIAGAIVPVEPLALPSYRELGTPYFTARREAGIINLGGPGIVRVGPDSYHLNRLDCLYLGAGQPDVMFESTGEELAEFYLLSCPAHLKCPSRVIRSEEAVVTDLGDEKSANKRRIRKLICQELVSTAQLAMGYTELMVGSIWNTMPPHTHGRRMEAYLYFDLEDGMVVHLMGPPDETRHLLVKNKEAVVSPSWSIHAGAGTRNYRFVWGMVGENQDFSDMDAVKLAEMK
jgi:4-deoxy-L-threo-5-hexosulose-uronate ketol-isomerase